MPASRVTIGDLAVHRLGFGTMRLVGRGVLGPPPDVDAARACLRLLPELGVDFVDTANAYGPLIAEMLVREVLHPYANVVVATKGGLLRPGPFQWQPDGRPAALRRAVENSCRVLGVERIALWQLHTPDPEVPLDEQLGAMAELQREGLIHHLGLSNVDVEMLERARAHIAVASVQGLYHVIDRTNEPLLRRCEELAIPFIAYYPLATGALAAPDSILTRVARAHGLTAGQAALAWLLHRSPVIVAIPGTQDPAHLRENVRAVDLALSPELFAELGRLGERANRLRQPRPR